VQADSSTLSYIFFTFIFVKMVMIRNIALFGALTAAAAFDWDSDEHHGKFLGSRANHMGPSGHVDFDLLADLEKAVGKDQRAATENRVARLEKALKPMFAAMPKMANGNVDQTGVRYLLHRLFVQRHGWFVNGLDNGGEAWNSSSPTAVFAEHAADHHGVFEDNLHKGFGVHQVAVFAAALEALVHGESMSRLQAVYRVLGMTESETLTDQEGAEAIRAYMIMYISGANTSSVSELEYKAMKESVYEMYPTFSDTESFVRGVRNRILEDVVDDERTSWQSNLKVVEEVAERYGRWQDKECHVLKGMLTEREQKGTGRVLLEDFYGPALNNGSWQFVESVPYLRQLGALDESNPKKPSVIIPNYLNSPANCVASSKFYSVCCIDQCEDLLGHLETKIAAPEATPAQIVKLISALPSDTVQAPRVLANGLTAKLEDIAAHHGGKVPLHGRLFAQWMHHAYPRECPYPHLSGTTNPLTQEEWIETQGEEGLIAGEDDIRAIMEAASAEEASGAEMPWSTHEELFVGHHGLFEKSESSGKGYSGAGVFIVMAPFAAVAAAAKYYDSSGTKKPKGILASAAGDHKYYV